MKKNILLTAAVTALISPIVRAFEHTDFDGCYSPVKDKKLVETRGFCIRGSTYSGFDGAKIEILHFEISDDGFIAKKLSAKTVRYTVGERSLFLDYGKNTLRLVFHKEGPRGVQVGAASLNSQFPIFIGRLQDYKTSEISALFNSN